MKAKHTKEFALEKAKEEYPEKFDHSPACINKQSRPPFIKGFMTAIEETNHIEVLEALKEITDMCDRMVFTVKQSTMNKAFEAIRKAEEELNQSKDA